MKSKAILQGVLLVLLLAVPAAAGLGSGDTKPAATLLLPYFEVDLSTRAGVTTMFSIGNATAEPALAKVTLWTDWSIPTRSFYVYLTGYDVETIDLRDIFDGILPTTADFPRDPTDEISPVGPFSMDGKFLGCGANLMMPNPLGQRGRNQLRRAHSGKPLNTGDCVGEFFGDSLVRGYVTIDNLNQCNGTELPTAPGYFVDMGMGIASNKNQLWGDYFYVDSGDRFAQGDALVHIEADDFLNAAAIPLNDPDTGGPAATIANLSGYTFYGRYTGAGEDNREPLATSWAVRYLLAAGIGSQIIVWRDSTSADVTPPGDGSWCGVGPSWSPMAQTEVVAFDLQEDAVELCSGLTCFPRETGRYQVGSGELDPPFLFGWFHLNLNVGIDTVLNDTDFGTDGTLAQGYVSLVMSDQDQWSVGMQAIPVRSAFVDDDAGIGPVP